MTCHGPGNSDDTSFIPGDACKTRESNPLEYTTRVSIYKSKHSQDDPDTGDNGSRTIKQEKREPKRHQQPTGLCALKQLFEVGEHSCSKHQDRKYRYDCYIVICVKSFCNLSRCERHIHGDSVTRNVTPACSYGPNDLRSGGKYSEIL